MCFTLGDNMTMDPAKSQSVAAKKIAITAWVVVFACLLVPFLFLGENWSMVWFLAAAPISIILEEVIGIGSDSILLIALASAATASMWALVIYGLARCFYSLNKKPNKS
jgi:hypothetical protein